MSRSTNFVIRCVVLSLGVVSCGKIGVEWTSEIDDRVESLDIDPDASDASRISSSDNTDNKNSVSGPGALFPSASPSAAGATTSQSSTSEQTQKGNGDVLEGFNFAPSNAVETLNSRHREIFYLSKVSADQTVFSFTDGTAALFDENLGSVKEIRFLEPFDRQVITRIVVSERRYWEISKDSLSLNVHSQVGDNSEQPETQVKKFKLQGDFDGAEVLYLSDEAAVLRAGKGLRIIRFKGANYSEQKIAGNNGFEEVVPKILAAGLSDDGSALWLATSESFYQFTGVGAVFQLNGRPKKMKLGLSSDQQPRQLALAFDFKSGAVSASFLNTYSGLLLNNVNQFFPAWNADVMPLAQEYCLSCHADVPMGGFGQAGQEASWVAYGKRIMARIAPGTGVAPMPPTYAPNQPSDSQKRVMLRWLMQREKPRDNENKVTDTSSVSSSKQTPAPTMSADPTNSGLPLNPGNQGSPAWTADVKPLAQKYCLTCHGNNAVGGFGQADQEASWVAHRQRIMARIAPAVGVEPMPPTYVPNQPSESEKRLLQAWLMQFEKPSESENKVTDTSSESSSKQTPRPTASPDPVTVSNGAISSEQTPRPTTSPDPGATGSGSMLSVLAPQFGRLPSLANLEKISDSIAALSKIGQSETIVSMTDGSAFLYNELSDSLRYLQPVIRPVAGSVVFLFPGSQGWQVSGNKIDNFSPAEQVNATGSQKIQVVTLNINGAAVSVIGAYQSHLILKGERGLYFVTKMNDSIVLESLSSMPTLVQLLPDLVAAGFGPNKEFLWAASRNRVFFFRISAEGFLNPIVRDFDTAGFQFSKLAIGFDKDFSPVGRIVLHAPSQLLLSGVNTVERPLLAWETDIRPIAEQFCLSCHGESGAGGFSRANEQSSWTGIKRSSIVARVFEEKTMPPTYTNASKQMTLEQREKIKNWLSAPDSLVSTSTSNVVGSTNTSPTPAVTATPVAVPVAVPVPGPTWTNVVKPLMDQYCQSCHSSLYSDFKNLYDSRAAVINSLETKRMPRPGSSQAAAMTQEERESILVYLRGLR